MLTLFMLATILNPIDPNPFSGPNGDWAPLVQAYSNCETTTTTYFSEIVCTSGLLGHALRPTYYA